MYEYVVSTVYVWVSSIRPCVWPSWIGLFVLLLHSGRCTVGLHRRRHGIRGVVVNVIGALQHTFSSYSFGDSVSHPLTLGSGRK